MTDQPTFPPPNNRTAKVGLFTYMKGWQVALILLPFATIFIAGPVGAAVAAVGAFGNAAIVKQNLSTRATALGMIGVVLACFAVSVGAIVLLLVVIAPVGK
ncbi:hypothetical protein ACFYS8_18655 [Kitasatospora sp. NPDC004615]|uniref:hypothetical protein n=1 Tax=Kitasatospora sp. NPDC004615 TaxID=3364017 RepID=UPI0036A2A5E9